jgi:hypothetical protein
LGYNTDGRQTYKELGSLCIYKKEVRQFQCKKGFDQKRIQNVASSFQDPESSNKELEIDLEICDASFFELSVSFNCKD